MMMKHDADSPPPSDAPAGDETSAYQSWVDDGQPCESGSTTAWCGQATEAPAEETTVWHYRDPDRFDEDAWGGVSTGAGGTALRGLAAPGAMPVAADAPALETTLWHERGPGLFDADAWGGLSSGAAGGEAFFLASDSERLRGLIGEL